MHDAAESASGELSRRTLLAALTGIGLTSTVFARALWAQAVSDGKVTAEMIRQAEWIADIQLTDPQREKLAGDLQRNLRDAARLREVPCDADVPPANVFRPDFFCEADAQVRLQSLRSPTKPHLPIKRSQLDKLNHQSKPLPESKTEIAFASLIDQASWLESGRLSSVELTQLYIDRINKFDPTLHLLVTSLADRAIEQAKASDQRRAAGQSLSLLDGIPWVAKDLIAVPPFKTTWGAEPFRDQVRPTMATVAQRIEAAGGVLLAKVSLGALAWGDIWFGGTTRNPWQPDQGSSGSSAGTCSAVVAGLASYGIGSETLGSIVSPCTRCAVSGLRPSYGRVSRAGCMPLAWTFDKLGPIARHVNDLGIIFSHILGPDGLDPSVVERDFDWPETTSLAKLTIGTTKSELSPIEQQALDWLKSQGAQHRQIELPNRFPEDAMTVMLNVEAATVFDDILRSKPEADLGLWPASFRKSQYVPAIQYLRACRLRTQLITETETALRQVDVLLGADDLVLTNLSGHPSLVLALGSREVKDQPSRPATVKLTGAMYREATLLNVASQLQQAIPPKSLQENSDWSS